jgi:hypothetical protein
MSHNSARACEKWRTRALNSMASKMQQSFQAREREDPDE